MCDRTKQLINDLCDIMATIEDDDKILNRFTFYFDDDDISLYVKNYKGINVSFNTSTKYENIHVFTYNEFTGEQDAMKIIDKNFIAIVQEFVTAINSRIKDNYHIAVTTW